MTSSTGMNTTHPTPAEIEDLKRLAAGIIRAQGNRFVKTLLRSKDIQVGANKDEFQANRRVLSERVAFCMLLGAVCITSASPVIRPESPRAPKS